MGKRLTLKEKVQRLITAKHTAADLSEASQYLAHVAKRSLRISLRPRPVEVPLWFYWST